MNLFNTIGKKIHGTGITKLPVIKTIYKLFFFILEKINKNDIISNIKVNKLNFKIKYNLKDGFISKVLYSTGIYERHITNFFIENLKKGDQIIDIGANIGYFSIIGGIITGDKGKVHSFEPVNYTYNKLKNNIKLNKLNNIYSYKYALGEIEEKLNININPSNIGNNSIVNKTTETQNKEEIIVKVFDNEINILKNIDINKVKIIKIDVEGFEFNVLKGMKTFLNNYEGFIVMEFSPYMYKKISTNLTNDFIIFLKMMGFNSYNLLENGKIGEKINLNLFSGKQVDIILKKQ